MKLQILIPYFAPVLSERMQRNMELTSKYLRTFHSDVMVLYAPNAFGPDDHAIWQKERLINHAVAQLPGEVDTVAWIDGDIMFSNPYWLETAERMLKNAVAVQLFSQFWRGNHLGEMSQSSCFRGAVSLWKEGLPIVSPGGAWIARRELFTQGGGLYDCDIVGGGDSTAFHAWTGMRWKRSIPAGLSRSIEEWSHVASGFVRGRISHVPGSAIHLWHGDRENRQYNERYQILLRHDFDPQRHLTIGSRGAWQWSEAAPMGLRRDILAYFEGRKTDSG